MLCASVKVKHFLKLFDYNLIADKTFDSLIRFNDRKGLALILHLICTFTGNDIDSELNITVKNIIKA